MKIKIARFILNPSTKLQQRDAVKLRGYIAGVFPEESSLHNHTPDNKLIYRYPQAQFKIVNGTPILILIQNSIKLISKIEEATDTLKIEKSTLPVFEKIITISEEDFGLSGSLIKYRFCSPWLSLNQDNHIKYIRLPDEAKKEFLGNIFTANLLSMSKSLNYTVEGKIMAYCEVREIKQPVKFKERELIGFTGHVTTNFSIPDLLGVGKSPARGFGTLMKIA